MVVPKRVVSFDKNRPRILSPLHKCEYFTLNIGKTGQKLALLANASFDTDKLYWFINDTFYATSDVGERLFWAMEKGRHKITCVDKQGRSSFIRIVVR
jgi:membrane carboxypeptidase/penicillin-binding protein PbpC